MDQTVYNVYTEYLFKEAKKRHAGADLIILVYNGLDYYSPATPKDIVRLTSAATLAATHVNDAICQVSGIVEAIPPSDAKGHLSKALMHMGAAKQYLHGAKLTSGTASTADLPITVPLPQTDLSTVARPSRKRAALTVVLPEKKNWIKIM